MRRSGAARTPHTIRFILAQKHLFVNTKCHFSCRLPNFGRKSGALYKKQTWRDARYGAFTPTKLAARTRKDAAGK